MVDIKITTVMDLELKTAFELAFASNPKKFKEALGRGALNMLEEQDPLKASELRISRYLELIDEERKKQDQFKAIQKISKKEVKKQTDETSVIEANRLNKYEEGKQSITFQVNNNTVDWKHLSSPSLLNFKTPYETEVWTKEQLFKDKLIGCENCRKWKAEEQHCPYKKQVTKPTYTCKEFKKV